MNFIKSTLAIAMLAFGFEAGAQFYPGPATGQGIYMSSPLLISTATSNLQAGAAASTYGLARIPIGRQGVGLQTVIYSPVALSATNIAVCFQGSVDGLNWFDSPANVANVVTYVVPNGTTITTTYTNFQVVPAAAHNNLGNIRYLRPTWITNNNGTNWLYISNCVWSISQ